MSSVPVFHYARAAHCPHCPPPPHPLSESLSQSQSVVGPGRAAHPHLHLTPSHSPGYGPQMLISSQHSVVCGCVCGCTGVCVCVCMWVGGCGYFRQLKGGTGG